MMTNKDIEELLQKRKAGKCTEQEAAFLESWFIQWNKDVPLGLSAEELDDELDIITQSIFPRKEANIFKLWPQLAAAAVILLLSAVTFLYFSSKSPVSNQQTNIPDIVPGNNKLILTLANGNKIVLSAALKGRVAKQNNAVINKTEEGLLVYSGRPRNAATQAPEFNTISIPAGGHLHLVLADGTGVWLNALSTIRFPVAFTGAERRVDITGEAYFEVVHKANKPFRVMAGGCLIEDIGTHFNVNSYNDELTVKTTLLEGSVKIHSKMNSRILQPGQQSQVMHNTADDNIEIINNADLDEVIGWKDGVFRFHNTAITEVMKQVARWYDVDVKYSGDIKDKKLSGEISRDVNVSNVFEMLRFFKVKFTIEQHNNRKQIIVSKA